MTKTTQAKRNAADRNGRCLCGLRIALHFTSSNRKLSCEQAQHEHANAKIASNSFTQMLLNAGAQQ